MAAVTLYLTSESEVDGGGEGVKLDLERSLGRFMKI